MKARRRKVGAVTGRMVDMPDPKEPMFGHKVIELVINTMVEGYKGEDPEGFLRYMDNAMQSYHGECLDEVTDILASGTPIGDSLMAEVLATRHEICGGGGNRQPTTTGEVLQ